VQAVKNKLNAGAGAVWQRLSSGAGGEEAARQEGREKAAEIKRGAQQSPVLTSFERIKEQLKRGA
jgi:hypothetical protein